VTAGTKTCPDCAEEVREAANVCRFCGYRFAPLSVAAAAPDAPETRAGSATDDETHEGAPRAKWWDYAILSGVGQFVAVAIVGAYASERVYEHPLPYLLDLLLVTAVLTWILRRPYTGVLKWWRRAIPVLWVLGLVSRVGQSETGAALAQALSAA
jgi:hypothetical protein